MLANAEIRDQEKLIDLYTSDRDIYITSDGGAHDYQGTVGVIISDRATPVMMNHEKLYSPVSYESSYRSEAYGLLAGIKTLKYPINALGVNIPRGKTIIMFCDNNCLVRRTNKRRTTRITVNQHCYADIDLELQIMSELRNLQEMDVAIIIRHVQGHKKS
jgi:hypothetical protein